MLHTVIQGTIAPGFESVRDTFAHIAGREEADYSAQLNVCLHGETVVDLWTGPAMQADTLLGAYSASKGAAHLVVAMLVQDGTLALDRRVSDYWPAFAAEGKRELSLRDLLAHRAGLIGSDQGFNLDELADDAIVAERLAAQRPFWRPGTTFGYHALVIGALSGEVVRRATGVPLQSLFARLIRDGARADVHLGLPASEDARFLPARPMTLTPERCKTLSTPDSPLSLNGIAFNRHHAQPTHIWELPNHERVRRLGAASLGGVASARGLARMYAAAISSVDGRPPMLQPETIGHFGQIQSAGQDLVLGGFKAFTPGFHATSAYYPMLGAGSFGHSGAGGQQAFADPRHGIAYGYTRRRCPFPAAAAPENADLIAALYAALPRRPN